MIPTHPYNKQPVSIINGKFKSIHQFDYSATQNIDQEVVDGFGEEWEKFFEFSNEDIMQLGNDYFGFLSEKVINKDTTMLDVGCGTGRWTKYLASKVKFVEAIDPSKAIFYADHLLSNMDNVRLSIASTENIPFDDNTFDFVMSVGVLHHIPDTQKAMMD
ncbi:MAG: class I SAM-dependent methyltransferase, partial [Saprospiraceae bacterium]